MPLTECQVEPPDSCRPMMPIMLWLHTLWPCHLGLCLLAYEPLWWSQRSICWSDFSWCPVWLDSNAWRAIDGPSGFFLYPLDIAWVVWHNILAGSSRLRWAIPGIVVRSGACDGSWFLAKNPASGKKDTTFWCWLFPLLNTHLPDATLSACKHDRHCAESNANRNTVFIIRDLRPVLSSEVVPLSSTSDANGGLINADRTRCRSHLAIIYHCTGRSSLNALMSSLMCRSAAGSYFQWCNTEATDMWCEMMADGSNPSLNKCMRYVLKWWLLTLKTCHRFVLQKWTDLPQCDSYTFSDDWRRDLDIISAASHECVGQNDVLGEQQLTFSIQWDWNFLRQFQKFWKPGSCFMLGSYQYPLYSVRLVDLLQHLRDQLERWERIQEAPPVVPGSGHRIRPLCPGVRIWWDKLDQSSVAKSSKDVYLRLATQCPLGCWESGRSWTVHPPGRCTLLIDGLASSWWPCNHTTSGISSVAWECRI